MIGNNIVKSNYFLIKPPKNYFNKANSQIHGITSDTVKNCSDFSGVFPHILKYLQNTKAAIAHNAQFDMSILCDCADYFDLEVPEFIYLDSINLSSQIKSECGDSLKACADFFNIKLDEHHNALCDAKVCAEIVIESIKRSKAGNLAEFVLLYPEINRKRFSELKEHRESIPNRFEHSHSTKFEHINLKSIKPQVPVLDETNTFYCKNCVLTGELSTLSRQEAMQKIVNLGGIIKTSVSSKTDFLIVGTQDINIVGEDGLSNKEEKAYSLIDKGYDIHIIKENEFLDILSKEGKLDFQ